MNTQQRILIGVFGAAVALSAFLLLSRSDSRSAEVLDVANDAADRSEALLRKLDEVLVRLDRIRLAVEGQAGDGSAKEPSGPVLRATPPQPADTADASNQTGAIGNTLREIAKAGDPSRLATDLGDWDTQRSLRANWLLSGPDEVLAAFGVPFKVEPMGQGEQWLYAEVQRGLVVRWYRLRFHNRRLYASSTWKQTIPLKLEDVPVR